VDRRRREAVIEMDLREHPEREGHAQGDEDDRANDPKGRVCAQEQGDGEMRHDSDEKKDRRPRAPIARVIARQDAHEQEREDNAGDAAGLGESPGHGVTGAWTLPEAAYVLAGSVGCNDRSHANAPRRSATGDNRCPERP
jgi:hypothetical protein